MSSNEELDAEARNLALQVLQRERLMFAALRVLRDEESGACLATRVLTAEAVLEAGLTPGVFDPREEEEEDA